MSSSDRTASLPSSNPPLSQSFYNNADNPLANNSGNAVKQQPPSNKKHVLRPVAVRERSKAIPGCKELKNKDDPFSSTIDFLIVPPAAGGEDSKPAQDLSSSSSFSSSPVGNKENSKPLPVRISVFCDTGTVGTAKVIGGQVRQAFRRNVTSLDVVERLLRHPEGPLQINDQLIGVTDTEDEHDENNDASAAGIPNFKKGVELADVGLCILEGEREKLAKHLRNLDDEAAKDAFEARAAAAKEQQIRQRKQEAAAKQKQLQQQQLQQLTRPPAQQPPSKKVVEPPSGEMQAQMLEKAMANSNNNRKGSGGNSNRIGRRRNKLNNLRKNRNLDHSKKHNESSSAHEMNKTKRRGGKQGAASESSNTNRSSDDGKKQSRSTARVATKMTTITANTGGPTTTNNYDDDHDDSDSDASSAMSTSEYNKKVADNNNKTPINSFKSCGYEFHFKLPAEVMNQVDQCLRDIAKMNKVVKGVATNGRGTVFLYGNGGVAYTPAIPKALYQKLRQLRSSSFSSRPCFVALGTRDRYYVSFNDGSGDWKASSSLDKMLKKRVMKNPAPSNSSSSAKQNSATTLPRSVAFGATYDTFFVVFNDGSWEYQGRAIPKSLEKKLRERDDADDLVLCNLGPNGEWFLKAENGKMWWSGISPELDSVLKKITKNGYLHSMDFGENGSYFVSYDEE
jgi:hypothetical protein